MDYAKRIEGKLKAKKLLENYTEISNKKPQNEIKADEKVTNSPPIKRGDYKDWKENWRINDNPLLVKIEERGFSLWIDEKAEVNYQHGSVINKIAREKPGLFFSNKLQFNPFIKKRFYQVNGAYFRNAFTPTEYMKLTQEPTKEPTSILIRHLVNYQEDRYKVFY